MQPATTRAAAALQGHVAPTGGSVPSSPCPPSGLAFRMSAVPDAGSSVPERREERGQPCSNLADAQLCQITVSELWSSLLPGCVAFDLQAKVFSMHSELTFNKKPCGAHRILKSPGNGAAIFSAEEQRGLWHPN